MTRPFEFSKAEGSCGVVGREGVQPSSNYKLQMLNPLLSFARYAKSFVYVSANWGFNVLPSGR